VLSDYIFRFLSQMYYGTHYLKMFFKFILNIVQFKSIISFKGFKNNFFDINKDIIENNQQNVQPYLIMVRVSLASNAN
jgi:hypothetical protein